MSDIRGGYTVENINFEFYKVFYYVAKYQNVTKAAEKLCISQPAVTQTIKKLEDALGYELFFRTSRGMNLTQDGEDLFERIKDSILCLEQGRHFLNENQEERKVIRIGGSSTLLKHNALTGFVHFKKKYPDVQIEIERGITVDLLNKLERGLLDLVLFNMPTEIGEMLESEVIEEVQDAFIVKSGILPKNMKRVITNKELESLPKVLQSPMSTSRKYLDHICKKNHIHLLEGYNLESYDLVLAFVSAGLGVGFVNKKNEKKELEEGSLSELKTEFSVPKRKIGIARNKKSKNNIYINSFIKMIKEK